ncbi:MAG TPA: hypothetical protein VH369_14320 [Bryobacteraceae bacterium]|jgi:hypothetical protein
MSAQANIRLPETLLEQAQKAAQAQGTSVDELAANAVQRELIRLFWEKNKRDAALRRGNMTDEEVEELVDRAIAEDRAGRRGR